MKYFKCGQCGTPFKIDETTVKASQVACVCTKCNSKNILRFGPHLIVQTKDKPVKQYALTLGTNTFGRKNIDKEKFILVDDKFVSKTHGEILIMEKDGKLFFYIKDAGSLNGIFTKDKTKIPANSLVPFLENDFFIAGLTKLSIKYNL